MNFGVIVISGSIDSLFYIGSWYLDSMCLLLPIMLLFIIILCSLLLLFSIELYSLSATKMEVIGSQWCWYYYYSSSLWNWYYDSSSLSFCDLPISLYKNGYNPAMNAVVINRILDSSLLIIYYLFYYSIQLTQSLISSYSFSNYWSHLSLIDSFIYFSLCQSLALYLSAFDVIHSYGINSLYYRFDCIPGRINSLYYYYLLSIGLNKGYCYELCGIGHFSMQIKVIIIYYLLFIFFIMLFWLSRCWNINISLWSSRLFYFIKR